MHRDAAQIARGLEALRLAVRECLAEMASGQSPATSTAHASLSTTFAEVHGATSKSGNSEASRPRRTPSDSGPDDGDFAASSAEDEADRERLIALVELARSGDKEAFGMLFDHYQPTVYRFLYYRTRSQTISEDLTSETFFRALRSMNSFRWQGKDFGAWLTTIARNLVADHYKASRTRLERPTDDMSDHDDLTDSPEDTVLDSLTHDVLLTALKELPHEQQECLIMRFLQSMSIAETAAVLGRSEGAVKQLQLRGVRNLAKRIPEDCRP